jgi:Icc-related predicted phosphoesterase
MAKKDLIPVFGDIHGNVEGLVNTMEYIQKEFGLFPDTVLQVGDIGYFQNIPETEKIKSDQELSLHRYLTDVHYANKLLDRTSFNYKIAFVRGNHEDQKSLKDFTKNNPRGGFVDDQNRFWFVPDGRTVCIDYENDVTLAGLGGIDLGSRPKAYQRNPLIAFSEEDIEKFEGMNGIDILMSHQGPTNTVKGSNMINIALDFLKPKIHLHGHSHRDYSQTLSNGVRSYGIGKMPQNKRPFLESNNFYGFLDTSSLEFSYGTPLPLFDAIV